MNVCPWSTLTGVADGLIPLHFVSLFLPLRGALPVKYLDSIATSPAVGRYKVALFPFSIRPTGGETRLRTSFCFFLSPCSLLYTSWRLLTVLIPPVIKLRSGGSSSPWSVAVTFPDPQCQRLNCIFAHFRGSFAKRNWMGRKTLGLCACGLSTTQLKGR